MLFYSSEALVVFLPLAALLRRGELCFEAEAGLKVRRGRLEAVEGNRGASYEQAPGHFQ